LSGAFGLHRAAAPRKTRTAFLRPLIVPAPLSPVAALFLGGEKLNAHILFGTALILAGVLAVALPRKKEADSASRCAMAAPADEAASG
jgi:drug/metabolite transporter (DMT)-like permease